MFGRLVRGGLRLCLDSAEAQALVRMRWVPRNGGRLRFRSWGRKREHQRLCRVVGNVARHEVMFLMNVAVEDSDARERLKHLDHGGSIPGAPLPIRIQVKERSVREHDDARRRVQADQVLFQPPELLFAEEAAWVRDVIEDDEVNAAMIKRVVRRAEQALVNAAEVESRIALSRHQIEFFNIRFADEPFELAHAAATLKRVISVVRQISGEDDEIRFLREAVDGLDRCRQRNSRARIRSTFVAPMAIG